VADNGIGIPEDSRDEIFGVFRRVKSNEVVSVPGKGVGLATAKTVVEVSGGEMWVESQPGQGSTFYFTLKRSMVDPRSEESEISQTEAEKELAEIYAEDLIS
jgi:signal transduction histidine kinase